MKKLIVLSIIALFLTAPTYAYAAETQLANYQSPESSHQSHMRLDTAIVSRVMQYAERLECNALARPNLTVADVDKYNIDMNRETVGLMSEVNATDPEGLLLADTKIGWLRASGWNPACLRRVIATHSLGKQRIALVRIITTEEDMVLSPLVGDKLEQWHTWSTKRSYTFDTVLLEVPGTNTKTFVSITNAAIR